MNSLFIKKNINYNNRLRIIFLTALLAGTLDILAAIVSTYIRFGLGPDRVFKFIASGVFGDSAFSGGTSMIFAGIIFHYFIASIWTLLFFILYPKLRNTKQKIIGGLLYGIIIWLIMNMIVVPLSNAPEIKFNFPSVLFDVTYLMLFVGLPISLMYHKYYSNETITHV